MKNVYRLFLLTLLSAAFVVACSDDDDSGTTPTDTEFVAEYSDFEGYESWELVDESVGVDPGGNLSGAHEEATAKRISRVNKTNIKMENGEWPVGTIIVKEMRNAETDDLMAVMAMAKRGADFNPDHNGWEWFMLNVAEEKIEGQGADLMGGMCNGCHIKVKDNDYSFVLNNQ